MNFSLGSARSCVEGEKTPKLTVGSVTLDANACEVWKGKKKVELSPKEFSLLHFLLRHKGIAQDRPRIIEHVWGGRDELMFS